MMITSVGEAIFHETNSFLQFVPLSEPQPIFLERGSNPLHVITSFVALIRSPRLLDFIFIVYFLRWIKQMVAEDLLIRAFNVNFIRFKLFFVSH